MTLICHGERYAYRGKRPMSADETHEETREERAARYRKMAAEAEIFARISKLPDSRIEYLKLAANWLTQADQIERKR
jgi:hypothetical protein